MRKLLMLCVAFALVFTTGCTARLNMQNVHREPHFAGVVVEAFDNLLLVRVNEGEEARRSSDLIYVPLDVELSDSMTSFMSGDEIVVYFDGTIMETYPAQISRVYAIVLTSPDKKGYLLGATRITAMHTMDGHTTGSSFTEQEDIRDLYDWFRGLVLTKAQFPDGENPGEAGIWEFSVYQDNGEYLLFSYGEFGLGNWYLHIFDEWYRVHNPTNLIFPVSKTEAIIFEPPNTERVDLGCCVVDIAVRDRALLGANSIAHTNNNFTMTLNTDRHIYNASDEIRIWGTLEYIGDNDTIEIWHGCPFMLFTISGGKFGDGMGGATVDILTSSVLERGRVYHFEYRKSGGWSADDPDATFWEDFFSTDELMLSEGEYTITLIGGFGLSERVLDSESGLRAELEIIVTR